MRRLSEGVGDIVCLLASQVPCGLELVDERRASPGRAGNTHRGPVGEWYKEWRQHQTGKWRYTIGSHKATEYTIGSLKVTDAERRLYNPRSLKVLGIWSESPRDET
jgi:hypothetical protein